MHQYVSFGITFRQSFYALKHELFYHCIDKKSILNTPADLPTDLLIPILYMTATFNDSLLSLLQKMTGICILPNNFFWCGCSGMSKRTINIAINSSSQYLRNVKKHLLHALNSNHKHKCIVHGNAATSLTQIKDSVDNWLDHESPFLADTLLITGDVEPELKLACTEEFASPAYDDHINNIDLMSPRILFATATCIGAGLDCSSVFSALRLGLSSSILDFIQEMGRCGRGRQNDGANPTDNFHIAFNINDFMHMHERIHKKIDISAAPVEDKKCIKMCNAIINDDELIRIQVDNLMELTRLMVGNNGICWHAYLERKTASPMTPDSELNECADCAIACPICRGDIHQSVLPLVKDGCQDFLVDLFITDPAPDMTISALIKRLQTFPNVGSSIYGRVRSAKAPETKFLHVTILQFISFGFINMRYDNDSNKTAFVLGMTDKSPSYLIDANWRNISVITK